MQTVSLNARTARAAVAQVAAAAGGAPGAPEGARSGEWIPVLLLEGAAQYYARDYVSARASFARVITLHPQCSAGVRVALGQCLWQLGHAEVRAWGARGGCGRARLRVFLRVRVW